MSSIPVPLKTHRVGERCTLKLSRAQTFSDWCGVVVNYQGVSSFCPCRSEIMRNQFAYTLTKADIRIPQPVLPFVITVLQELSKLDLKFIFEKRKGTLRKNDFFSEENTAMPPYSGFVPESTRLQAEGRSLHTGWETRIIKEFHGITKRQLKYGCCCKPPLVSSARPGP
ncbi:hypothetical protein TNCV_799391 [Trichonephila clavipes]|nr:hypothetical protein TNCV_799391 [Trichonephila clavipes]